MCIPCTDPLAAADWFENYLGFSRVLVEELENGVISAVLVHATGDVFHLRQAPSLATSLRGFPLISLAVPDREALDEWRERLASQGVSCSLVEPAHLGWSLTTEGPDGIHIQLRTTERISGLDD